MVKVLDTVEMVKLRVLSGDRVLYVVYDGGYRIYADRECRHPEGLWAWEEQEIIEAVKKNVAVSA